MSDGSWSANIMARRECVGQAAAYTAPKAGLSLPDRPARFAPRFFSPACPLSHAQCGWNFSDRGCRRAHMASMADRPFPPTLDLAAWRWPHFSPRELACRCGGHFCAGDYWQR